MGHAKAKLTVPGRQLLFQKNECEYWNMSAAAKAQLISQETAHKWHRRWIEEGPAGLEDRSSRPHSSPTRTSDEMTAATIESRIASRRGPHRIGYELGVAPSTVHVVLRRAGLSRLCDLDGPTGLPIRYVRLPGLRAGHLGSLSR